MSGRREVDSAAERYIGRGRGRGRGLWRSAVVRLFVGIVLLMVGNFALGAMVDEAAATQRAATGHGVSGMFTAYSVSCSRGGGCSWYGTFQPDGYEQSKVDRIQLRGADDDSVSAGDTVPALDVGSRDFVHVVGGSPEWGETAAAGFIAVLTGGMGTGSVAWVLWGVNRTRPSRASRRRDAGGRGLSAVRGLVSRDRWGWSARPGRSVVRAKMARSWGRTVAAAFTLIPLGAVAALQCFIWFTDREDASWVESVAGSWSLVLMAVMVTVAIQTLRLVLVRPRMWVAEDEIVIWDGLLLWKALRIPRCGIAAVAVRHGSEPGQGDEVADLTPFGQEVNLVLRMRDAVSLPARHLRWGNWFWVMSSSDCSGSRPTIPQRGRPVRSLRLRVKTPRRAATDLDRWLMDEQTPPSPRLAPDDHAYHGRPRTHHGAGSTRLKIKGRLARPVLAEFVNEGSGTLRASLRRTEFGRGIPVVSCGPGSAPAVTVLDDRWVTEETLTNRFLVVEADGAWTVIIGGPERSRSFTRSATGSGPGVLTYEGPPGIAVLTSPDGASHEVHLRGPDLAGLYGGQPAASAGAADGPSVPSLSTFAVPSRAVVQIRTDDEWRIEVTPLKQADADSPVPPTGRVRPFEGSIAGDRPAVVRYLGPPGRVLFRGGDGGFGLVSLDAALVPARTLTTPAGDQAAADQAVVELRSHTLVQVTGGSGTWSMQETHAGTPGRHK